MITFIIKSIICLAILFGFYKLFLERLRMFQFNRAFLLFITLFSVIVPNTAIQFERELLPYQQVKSVVANSFLSKEIIEIALVMYILVTIFLCIKFIGSIRSIVRKIRRNEKINYEKYTLVLLEETVLPHTFLHYVFVNKEAYIHRGIQKELFTHELAHVKEKHTLDVLCMEVFYMLFWFNPMVYYVKKAIRLNHEFIADDVVLQQHENRYQYQNILLQLGTIQTSHHLVSHVNYSITKKRFLMMTKNSSKMVTTLTKLLVFPFLMIAFILFADTAIGNEHTSQESPEETSFFTSLFSEGEHEGEGSTEEHAD